MLIQALQNLRQFIEEESGIDLAEKAMPYSLLASLSPISFADTVALPQNPTEEQLKGIVQAIAREEFEPDAVVTSLAVTDGGWTARYTSAKAGIEFKLTWDGSYFTKGVPGVVDDEPPAEFGEYLDFAAKTKAKPNCSPSKSHFCKTPNGSGSCVSLKKNCKYAPSGPSATAAKYVAKNTGNAKNAAPQAKAKATPKNSNIEILNQAFASGDFDKAIVAAKEIMDQGRQRAKNAVTLNPKYYGKYKGVEDVLFTEGTRAGNGTSPDWILAHLYSERGFNGLPKVVDQATLNAEIKAGAHEFYRGFGSSRASFDEKFTSLKEGTGELDYYAGHGVYGHDTYSAVVKNRKKTGTTGRDEAIAIGEKYGAMGGVIKGAMASDSKIVKQLDLAKEMNADLYRMIGWESSKQTQLELNGGHSQKKIDAQVKQELKGVNSDYGKGRLKPGGLWGDKVLIPGPNGDEDTGFFVSNAGGTWYIYDKSGNLDDAAMSKAAALKYATDSYKKTIAKDRAMEALGVDKAAIAKFDKDVEDLYTVMFGDSNSFDMAMTGVANFGTDVSGRYATIKGYDMVDLDDTYPGGETFALTLNRSKYIIQDTPHK